MSFFTVVRANVATNGRHQATEFVRWWADEHQREFLAYDGFRRAWLLEHVEHPHAFGVPGPRYAAVYDVDRIEDFDAALAAGPPWGRWQRFVDDWLVDWTRTYRRRTLELGNSSSDAAYWAIVAADFTLGEDERDRFDRWYDDVHIPELLANPGLTRAWRLAREPHPRELGPAGHRDWAIYELDHPDSFATARDRRAARGVPQWDGLWADHLEGWSISFFRVRNRLVKGERR